MDKVLPDALVFAAATAGDELVVAMDMLDVALLVEEMLVAEALLPEAPLPAALLP